MSKLRDVYASAFSNWITKGKLIPRDTISNLGLKTSYNCFLTRDYITKVWCIVDMNVYVSEYLIQTIKNRMSNLCPKVDTMIHTMSKPVSIPTNDRTFLSKARKANSDYQTHISVLRKIDVVDRERGRAYKLSNGTTIHVSNSSIEKMEKIKDSYNYVQNLTQKGHTFMETNLFIQASAENNKDMDYYVTALERELNNLSLSFVSLENNIDSYLDNYCPASETKTQIKGITSMLYSDENLAFIMPHHTRGICSGNGFPIGLSMLTGIPIFVDFIGSSGLGQTCVVVGTSGSGKTYQCENIAHNFVAFDVHCSVVDFKGNEWVKLAYFVPSKIITFDNETNSFVNTLRLDDINLEMFPKEKQLVFAKQMYDNAIQGTVQRLAVISDFSPEDGNTTDLYTILKEAVIKLYNNNGVTPLQPSTFEKTQYFEYNSVLEIIKELQNSQSYTQSLRNICSIIISRCSSFFKDNFSSIYNKEEITLNDILENPLIIYSLNNNSNGDLNVNDALKLFDIQFLDSKKQEIRKMLGLHSIMFLEEVQRYSVSPALVRYVSSKVSGSRSSNVTIFLLFNSISSIMSNEFKIIRSNITSFIIGKVTNEDIQILETKFDCKTIIPYIKKINEVENRKLLHSFAILVENGKETIRDISKLYLPPEMEKHYQTREAFTYDKG